MMGPIKSSPPASPQVGQPLCLPGKSKICRCYGLHLEILGSSIINPFRSNLITQIFIWKHSSFLSLLLRERQGSGKLAELGKCTTGSSLHNSYRLEEFFKSCKSSHQHLPPSETTMYPHIKASHQLPTYRINSLTEEKQRECWLCGINISTANNPNIILEMGDAKSCCAGL